MMLRIVRRYAACAADHCSWKDKMLQLQATATATAMASSSLDHALGLLRVRVVRGVNLAVRDFRSSDAYVVLKMGKQNLKTSVIRKNLNPEWNEDLTFSVDDPTLPIYLTVFDHDTFTQDDSMGDAEFGIQPFVEAVKMQSDRVPNGPIIRRIEPSTQNCLAGESQIIWRDGKVVQNLTLRLRNVECGEVELQLQWINLTGSKAY